MHKIIKTDAEYQEALSRLEALVDASPAIGSSAAEELELLGLLVENYEKTVVEIELPDPIDAIEFRMEQQNLSPRDLIPYLGSRSKVSEILARKRPLTLAMLRALHNGLGIPGKVLLQAEKSAPAEEEEDWGKYPLEEMTKRGWITGSLQSLRGLFAKLPPLVREQVLCHRTEYIRSARTMDRNALAAWTARVIFQAQAMKAVGVYKTGSVTPAFMRELAKQSRRPDGPLAAQNFLRSAGIPLIIEAHLPYTYLDGAAILVIEERPIVGLTLRHDRLDNFWYVLMHEVAHIALHSNLGEAEFIDDLDIETSGDPKEIEADALAGEMLIPADEWKKSAASRSGIPMAAESLAAKLNIHAAIVAGRLRHEKKAFRLFNNLVGHHEVRKHFPDVVWPD
ncbi:MAG: ImmA/IrrE family metallo-endopeptidase [Opitutaceae bacterium]|nr:ImmA/IrrE family metallo-endopeptidase [Opitutaceae bacterium]